MFSQYGCRARKEVKIVEDKDVTVHKNGVLFWFLIT